MERINGWLDQLPRQTVRVTGREAPAFRSIGIAGAYIGVLVFLTGVLLRGFSLVLAGGVGVVVIGSFFGWALLRRRLTKREDLVLLEHVWVALAAVAAYVWALGEPIWTWIDVVVPGVTTFLAMGRIACLVAGCCHGYPSTIGVAYPAASREWPPVRLFPVQLIEAVALGLMTTAGLVALPAALPGAVALGIGAAYAVVRFGTENLRGDRLGLAARLMALVQLAAVSVAYEFLFIGEPTLVAGLLPVAALAAAAIFEIRKARRKRALPTLAVVRRLQDYLEAAVTQPGDEPAVHRLSDDLTVAVSGSASERHISIASATADRSSAAYLALLAFGRKPDVVTENGTVHVLLSRSTLNGNRASVVSNGVAERDLYFTKY